MMKRAAMFVGCILFAASAQAAVAKTSDGAQASSRSVLTTHELVLRDGSRMYGTIEREDDVEVVFRTQAGALVTVRRADIASLDDDHRRHPERRVSSGRIRTARACSSRRRAVR